jgi:flagellar basal-body rod protein FlgC
MNIIANNIANALSPRTKDGGGFRRQMVILRGEQLNSGVDPRRGGVQVDRIVSDPSPFKKVYEPGHPEADADGYVEYPNVNILVEQIDLIAAQRAYEANIAVIQSGRRMREKALEIIQA